MTINKKLLSKYTFVALKQDEFNAVVQPHRAEVFANAFELDYFALINKQEQEALRRLNNNLESLYSIYLVAYHNDDVVAWCWGRQETTDLFYMVNGAVLPPHRRQGIYTRLLEETISAVAQEGFQVVKSSHKATDSNVIMAHLKQGFVISGMELSDRFGTLVSLSYFFNDQRRNVMDVRSGQTRPSSDLGKFLKIS